jgi:hypothetical protein
MSPAHFTPEKQCYSVLSLQIFREVVIPTGGVFETIETEFAGRQPLEELVENQALSADLKQAVMACLCGESRRWTILELVERFKALGICASRAGVTDLELELELCAWAQPWRLVERGTEWFLAPKSEKSELLALLCGVRKLPVPRTRKAFPGTSGGFACRDRLPAQRRRIQNPPARNPGS